jgi:hypothetical protein
MPPRRVGALGRLGGREQKAHSLSWNMAAGGLDRRFGMACPASSGGTGLRAASQVAWRPARDCPCWPGPGWLAVVYGEPAWAVLEGIPAWLDLAWGKPSLRNCLGSGHPSVPGWHCCSSSCPLGSSIGRHPQGQLAQGHSLGLMTRGGQQTVSYLVLIAL